MLISVEVLIIGGGVIGLTLARALRKRGIEEIAVVDKGKFGREASFAAAGMLSPQVEADKDDYFFRFCLEANQIYPDFVGDLEEETGIKVDFDMEGTFLIAFCEEEAEKLRKRYEWQKKAGLKVEILQARQIRKLEPFISPNVFEALFFPDNGQLENRKLIAALEKYARLNKVQLISNTEIVKVSFEKGKIIAQTKKGQSFSAEKIVLATGAFTSCLEIEGIRSLLNVRPIRGQMIAFQATQRFFRRVIYTERGYIVPRNDGRILVGATVEDVGFDKSVTEVGVHFLLNIGREVSPALSNLKLRDKWAGLRPMAEDACPIIGEVPGFENLFVATAHYRNGILLAPITAEILADKLVKNLESKYLREFSPARFV